VLVYERGTAKMPAWSGVRREEYSQQHHGGTPTL
jgi:hypothetical protein